MPELNSKRVYFAGLVILVAVCSGIVFYQTSCRTTNAVQQAVENNRTGAQAAASESANAQKAAANSSVERRTEDAIREKTIKPRLEVVRQKSAQSAQEIKAATRKYENEKTNSQNLTVDNSDNCRKLRELFPNAQFDDCR